MDKQVLLGSLHSQITDLQKMVKDMAHSSSLHQLDKDMFKNKIIILYEDALKLQKIDVVPESQHQSVSESKPQIPEPQKIETPKVDKAFVATPPPKQPDPIPKPIPVTKPVQVEAQIEAPQQNRTPLGDRMKPHKEAVNEIYGKAKASTKSTSNPQPISDILIAIGLNDRFLFTRELFSNNSELFKSTVSKLNNMPSFDEATDYLSKQFDWNDDEGSSELFIQIVKRRFL